MFLDGHQELTTPWRFAKVILAADCPILTYDGASATLDKENWEQHSKHKATLTEALKQLVLAMLTRAGTLHGAYSATARQVEACCLGYTWKHLNSEQPSHRSLLLGRRRRAGHSLCLPKQNVCLGLAVGTLFSIEVLFGFNCRPLRFGVNAERLCFKISLVWSLRLRVLLLNEAYAAWWKSKGSQPWGSK